MSNPLKGETPLKLADGREFKLVLDMEGLIQAESAYGKPLPQLMADMNGGFVGASAALLQGALAQRHPAITRSVAADMFRTDAEAVANALGAATQAAFPDESAEGKASPAPAGKRSGGNGAKPV